MVKVVKSKSLYIPQWFVAVDCFVYCGSPLVITRQLSIKRCQTFPISEYIEGKPAASLYLLLGTPLQFLVLYRRCECVVWITRNLTPRQYFRLAVFLSLTLTNSAARVDSIPNQHSLIRREQSNGFWLVNRLVYFNCHDQSNMKDHSGQGFYRSTPSNGLIVSPLIFNSSYTPARI